MAYIKQELAPIRRRPNGLGATYLISWRLDGSQMPLKGSERSRIVSILRDQHGAEYFLLAYVVMDDGVYVLFKPNITMPRKVAQNWRSVMARTLAVECERDGAIWAVDTNERSVIGQFAIVSAADELMNKPRRKWRKVEDYRWAECLELW